MTRFPALDGCRGYFLVFMLIAHLSEIWPSPFEWLSYGKVSFVSAAHGFVFLSGVVSGLHYGHVLATRGDAMCRRQAWLRAWTVYRHHLLLILALGGLIGLAGLGGWEGLAGPMVEAPLTQTAAGVSLLYQPRFMDILPMYLLFLAATPFLLSAMAHGWGISVLAGSATLWLAAQTGLERHAWGWAMDRVADGIPGFETRAGFDPLAWQLLFVVGLWIGDQLRRGALDPSRIPVGGPEKRAEGNRLALVIMAFGLSAVFLATRAAVELGLAGETFTQAFKAATPRAALPLLHLASFAALTLITVWLTTSGRRGGNPVLRLAGGAVSFVLTLGWLRLLGRHSLQVYVFHVALVYAAALHRDLRGTVGFVEGTLMTVLTVAALTLPARLHELWRRRGRPAPASAAAADPGRRAA